VACSYRTANRLSLEHGRQVVEDQKMQEMICSNLML
jgi:hypothetical protein